MRGFIKCAHQQERVKLHTHFAQRHHVAQSSPCRDSSIKPLRPLHNANCIKESVFKLREALQLKRASG
ncbi:uncharacterized protein M421DRAFT_367045 [Didymella exigua CBS 183.55]|uniref:Uncharacterized protein n=1 Tax=Didymella exigua CBS 183.55 TaxID=1150837 RepID=A0A6A5R2Z7_9PLEO|nr:uncharacterized protein M421DRAFT_367045 [Didymella exigua CBS 183.55]KAF1922421.1 hypothetical protein M421DRAFT_367045 [Didymella exigua CBS 183.55]